MHTQSIKELSTSLRQGLFSSVELTKHYLQRITNHAHLNAFISISEEHALQMAAAADKTIKNGQGTSLTGIPMVHKDIFCTQQMLTTCGSKMLANFTAPYDASLVKRLNDAGVVLLGKTNMDEFAMGSANENSYFGPVKNPWDISCVPGGSSGGSAAAVAAGLAAFATGSDTGGSIRQPAAFCGITGLKPTYGLVSRFGMVAYASSLDQAGPMARSAEDIAYVLEHMAGFDSNDSTSVDKELIPYTQKLNEKTNKLRIGVPTCFMQVGLDAPIQDALQAAMALLLDDGAEIIELDLSLHSLWVPCYYVLACAEASSNLSRYDGIRFGHRSTEAETLLDLITHSRGEGFGPEVKRRILTGTHVLSAGFFDAYYLKAQKVRRMIQTELLQQLEKVDVILGPTTPTLPFKIGQPVTNPVQNYLADVFTVAANLAGIPALSIPIGFNNGLPIGMQLMGKHFSESTLLQAAYRYQQKTDWHMTFPQDLQGA